MKTNTKKLRSGQSALQRFAKRFRRDEDGALIVFSLYMFIMILWFGGMAVDLMRFETTRAKLQATLDRATLAAADLDQALPCEDVVRDYFAKAGMTSFLDDIDCDEGINYRVASADASAEMPLFFYDLPKVLFSPFTPEMTALTVHGESTAEERVSDVEISLVLDVSSSMYTNNRIGNLRPAAREFVTTILNNNTNAPNGLITISMVPYSAVVNPGSAITPHLNLVDRHTYSSCPLFPDNTMFETTELDLDETYDRVAHFDGRNIGLTPINNPWCFTGDKNSIVVASANETALHDAIDALRPFGNTAIDMGVKWAVGLLDPSTRDIINSLAGQSGTNVPAAAAGRPQDFGTNDVLKVVVLMTDGQNTYQWDLKPPFKSGLSYVWFDLENNPNAALHSVDDHKVSIQYQGVSTPTNYWDDRFYWNPSEYANASTRRYPRGYSSRSDYVQAMQNGATIPGVNGIGPTFAQNVRRASWQELFANWEVPRVNSELMYNAYENGSLSYNDYIASDYAITSSVVNGTQANSRLSDICQAARDKGIVIYTVAFEAPTAGQTALRDCASSSSHYFDVEGTDISDAFAAIASDIRALKLTE